jgi:hypothetical protein
MISNNYGFQNHVKFVSHTSELATILSWRRKKAYDLLVKGHNRFEIADPESISLYYNQRYYLSQRQEAKKRAELNDVSSCLLSIEHKDLINHIELLL